MTTFGTIGLLLLTLLSLPNIADARWDAPGLSYYEKPGDKPITTPYVIYSSSRIIFTGSGAVQWADGTVSTSSSVSLNHATLSNLGYSASGHTGFQANLSTASWTAANAGSISGVISSTQIAAGSLPVTVITSSVAVNAVYPLAVQTGTYSNITLPAANVAAGSLGAEVICSSLSATVSALFQPADADLDDLADGSLTGSKVGDGVPAANIAAGSLDVDVIASSIAVNAVYPAAASAGTYSNITIPAANVAAGTLGANVIVSSIAVNAVYDGAVVNIAASKVNAGALGSSVLVSSVAANAVRRESLKDICLDATYVVLAATTTAGTNAVRISKFFDSAITISTVTAQCIGGTGITFNIEERTAPGTAGTDVWSSDVVADTSTWKGGAMGNAGIAANAALYLVPTSWDGAVNNVEIKGWATRD